MVVLVCLAAVAFLYWPKTQQTSAFEKLVRQANNGEPASQMLVAQAYLSGTTEVAQNPELALQYYLKACENHFTPAMYELAQLLLAGEKLPKDSEKGYSLLHDAAVSDYTPAQLMLGNLFEQGALGLPAHHGQAIFMWRLAASHGDAQAQKLFDQAKAQDPQLAAEIEKLFTIREQAKTDPKAALQLADAYKTGKWITQNNRRYLAWLKKAGELKDTGALYTLYELYTKPNDIVQPDEKEAIRYLHQAAEHGLAKAQYEVGMYTYEHATDSRDYQVAWHWFDLAADQGFQDAVYMRGLLRMEAKGGEKNKPIAMVSLEHDAREGQASAQYILGKAYWKGIGVEKDPAVARKWLEQAKQNGNECAVELLEEINQAK